MKSLKKLMGLILSLMLCICLAFPAMAAPIDDYSDVKEGQWYTNSVQRWTETGLLKGYEGTDVFGIDDSITRGQVATIMARMFGLTEIGNVTFSDVVDKDAYYYDAVLACANAGIINGIGGTEDANGILQFQPDANISREAAFKIVMDALLIDAEVKTYTDVVIKDILDKYTDAANVSDWADKYMAAIVNAGAVNGRLAADGISTELTPGEEITRAEFSTILDRLIAMYMDKDGNVSTYIPQSDIQQTAVGPYVVINAANKDVDVKTLTSSFENNVSVIQGDKGMIIKIPNPSGVPALHFVGNITGMQSKADERIIEVSYDTGVESFEGYAKIKVQGSSSLAYDKKNYTIKLYSDENCKEPLLVDVGWGEQNKYCLKANWIDKTHARNIVTANLVTEVQDKYNLLTEAPANGAIDGFPVEIYNNGEFLGLYTFNIPKDTWQFAMDEDNADHLVFCGEGWEAANYFCAPADFSTWSVEVGEENQESLDKLNRMFDFVINSSNEEFKTHFNEYLELDATLNYYILVDFAFLRDNTGKNMLLATYDGLKWCPSLYDLDTSWGTYWDGKSLYNYETGDVGLSASNLWSRIEQNYSQELSERYFELRQDLLTKEHVMTMFEEFEASIPNATFEREAARWSNIPGYDISQIETYLDTMIPLLDAKYAEMGNR